MYNLEMRYDRCVPVAAILVLLCCASSAIVAGSLHSHQVLVATVIASSHTSTTDDGVFELAQLALPQTQIEVDDNIPPQIEKNKFHNLPPPMKL